MLKALMNSCKSFKPANPENGKYRKTGLYLIMLTGILFSLTDLLLSIGGYSLYNCIPGDLTLIAIFIIGLLFLRHGQTDYVVSLVYLSPFPIYFFFISAPFSIHPAHETILKAMWILIPGFPFILFFDPKLKKLVFYFLICLLTLTYHLAVTNKLQDIWSFYWQKEVFILNPYLIITFVFSVCYLIAWNFERTLKNLTNKVTGTDALISKTSKMLQQGLLIMQIKHDETGNTTGLHVLKVNHAFEAMFKVGSRELRSVDADIIFPKVFRNSFDWNNFFLIESKQKAELHLPHLNKWVELFTLYPSKDQIFCLFYDITSRQQQIQKLEESSNRYKVLLEAIPDLFFIIDKDGIYVDFVIKESELIQIKPDDIIGNSIFETGFSEKMSRKIFQCIQDAIRFNTIETIEYALKVEKGTAMFEMRVAKLDDHSVIAIARDITKRKVAEIKLEEAKQKAEEADELKSAFLANISHEIRTPMNAIIGFSRMIGSPDFDTEEKSKFIEIIINNGKLLMEMINNMISISKIESNQVVPMKSFCKINDLMVELYRDYSLDLSNNPIKLRMNSENANPKFGFMTDKYLLTEIIKKLLDNAMKFTHQGEIEFGYRMDGKARICFFVKDTGIGIEPQNVDRIFERFLQVDNKRTRKYEGTGLGLSIAQHYAMLLKGKINVKSEVDKGSEFYFSIPFENEEPVSLKVFR